jgi:uncharacterized membrane protein YdbT with pleckstrin-like domain
MGVRPILCCWDTAGRKVIFFCGRMRLNSFERKEWFMSDEKTLFRGSSSPVVIIGTLLFCGGLMIAAVAASFFVAPPGNFLLWGVAGIALAYALMKWLFIKFRVYEVTTERIRRTTGILTRRTDELELYRVKDVTLVEPLVMRLFGCGNVLVSTIDTSTPFLELVCIRNAREVREQLRQSTEVCRDRKRVRVAEID